MTSHVVMVWKRRPNNLWHGECTCGHQADDYYRDEVDAAMADCRRKAADPKTPSKENNE